MLAMKERKAAKPMYVRAVLRAKTALKRLKTEMEAIDEDLTQEIIVTASWLWMEKTMEQIGAEKLVEELRPHIVQIKQALAAPGAQGGNHSSAIGESTSDVEEGKAGKARSRKHG